jgi:hypothetical protein
MARLSHCASALFIAAALAPPPAAAAEAIGGAAVVVNDVRGESAGRRARLAVGDAVFRDQVVQTAAASRAKFVFLDDTNMALGPESRAKLDRFVYAGAGSASRVTVEAARGAFRFISGRSPSEAYTVRTPQAVIGVRGTTYDVRVSGGRTVVALREGAVTVCVRDTARCRDLDQPGQALVVANERIEGPLPAGDGRTDFGDLCAGAPAQFCARTTDFALRAPAPPPRRRAEAPRPAPQRKAAAPARQARAAPPPRRAAVWIEEEEVVHVGPRRLDVWAPPPRVWRPHGGLRPRPERSGQPAGAPRGWMGQGGAPPDRVRLGGVR